LEGLEGGEISVWETVKELD